MVARLHLEEDIGLWLVITGTECSLEYAICSILGGAYTQSRLGKSYGRKNVLYL
jgi:hypothetical protein